MLELLNAPYATGFRGSTRRPSNSPIPGRFLHPTRLFIHLNIYVIGK